MPNSATHYRIKIKFDGKYSFLKRLNHQKGYMQIEQIALFKNVYVGIKASFFVGNTVCMIFNWFNQYFNRETVFIQW